MRALRRAGSWAGSAVASSLGLLTAGLALGALAGAAWGLSDRPDYAAVATVLAADRGSAELIGDGPIGGSGPDGTERLLELARGPEVGVAAAAALGADVSGADLIARTEIRSSDRGGALVIRSVADSADFAAAAANAFALGLTETAARAERRRLERATERLSEELGAAEPGSARAAELEAALTEIAALEAAGPPLRPGREAELPPEPESDRPVAPSAFAGGAIGFAIAVVSILGAEFIRRPVRTLGGLAAATNAPGLAALAPGRSRGRGGLASSEPGVLALDGPERDGYVSLAAAVGLIGDRPRPSAAGARAEGRTAAAGDAVAIAVASPMPGEGRSSVAIGLAGVAAAAGSEVLLIEADMRGPVLAERLGLPAAPGLADYLTEAATPRDVMRTLPVVSEPGEPGETSFVCVTAGTAVPSPAELLYSERFQGLVDRLRRVYDVVVFDTPPLLLSSDAAAVAARVDGVVLCAARGRTRRAELDRGAAAIEHARLAGGVLTSMRRGDRGSRLLTPRGR